MTRFWTAFEPVRYNKWMCDLQCRLECGLKGRVLYENAGSLTSMFIRPNFKC